MDKSRFHLALGEAYVGTRRPDGESEGGDLLAARDHDKGDDARDDAEKIAPCDQDIKRNSRAFGTTTCSTGEIHENRKRTTQPLLFKQNWHFRNGGGEEEGTATDDWKL